MEIYQLEQLAAISECGTLSKAAEQLCLSQPALSRSMQKLEGELQVKLFERTKNKLTLNENGIMAVEYANKVLSEVAEMTEKIRMLDRSRRLISIGSCAPAPLWGLLPALSQSFSEMTVSAETRDEEILITGLKNGIYKIIILPYEFNEPDYISEYCTEEQLLLSVPKGHRLAKRKAVKFKDFNGENMILYSDIGFWSKIPNNMLPNFRFLIQNERFAFNELLNSSVLLAFSTHKSNEYFSKPENRVNILIDEPKAYARFYLIFHKDENRALKKFCREYRSYSV